MTERAPFDSREFRSALGAFTTGVTIVTTQAADGTRIGVTANSFNSVSLEPPMILWSLAKDARSRGVFEAADHWAVHILAADQDELSNRFARSGGDKFAGLATSSGIGEAPLLENCASRLQCRTAFRYEGGDHVILVGEVLSFDRREVAPLVFQGGKYALAARKTDPAVLSGSAPRDSDISYGEDFLGYLLWRAHLHFRNRVMVVLEAQGLDAETFMILAMLLHRDGRTRQQLASRLLQLGPQDVSQHVEQFCARGWLRSEGTERDARVWLTAAGRDVTLHIHAASKAIEADLLDRLDAGERVAFKHLLRRFIVQTDGGLPHPWQDAT